LTINFVDYQEKLIFIHHQLLEASHTYNKLN